MAGRVFPQKVVINPTAQITERETRITAAPRYETRLNCPRLDEGGQIRRSEAVRLQGLERYQ